MERWELAKIALSLSGSGLGLTWETKALHERNQKPGKEKKLQDYWLCSDACSIPPQAIVVVVVVVRVVAILLESIVLSWPLSVRQLRLRALEDVKSFSFMSSTSFTLNSIIATTFTSSLSNAVNHFQFIGYHFLFGITTTTSLVNRCVCHVVPYSVSKVPN